MPSSPGIGMHVEVRDPDDKTLLSRVYSSEGRISFTSHSHGEHVICLYSNSTAWFSGTQLVSNKKSINQLFLENSLMNKKQFLSSESASGYPSRRSHYRLC